MNTVFLIGRLTNKPDMAYTQSGKEIAKFTLAVDRMGKDDGTDFIRVTTWGSQAVNCDRFLDKGSLVCVQGRITTGSYKNKNNETVYTTEVTAERVEFLSRKNENTEARTQEQASNSNYSDIPDGFSACDERIPF